MKWDNQNLLGEVDVVVYVLIRMRILFFRLTTQMFILHVIACCCLLGGFTNVRYS